MMIHVLNRLKTSVELAIGNIERDEVRDNNGQFQIPEPYTMRIGDFLITDEKVKLAGNAATMHGTKLTI